MLPCDPGHQESDPPGREFPWLPVTGRGFRAHGDFACWLATAPDTPDTAFAAHRRLVAIHPFNDGNGRTARLLMNLILIRGGYPPVPVRPEDRLEYIRSLQEEQAGQGADSFDALLYRQLNATLGST